MTTVYEIEHLHQPNGWLSPGYLGVGVDGRISHVGPTRPPGAHTVEKVAGFGVPGMPNVHSHAFQRALAGRCEIAESAAGEDNLWTWRQRMYDFVSRLQPPHYEALAAFVYLEMVKFGFTGVAEFHYVHHPPDAPRYAIHGEMAARLIAAARRVGIGLLILPTFYAHAGIGKPPLPEQRRFVHDDVDDFLRLVESLRPHAGDHRTTVGVALHSLRAVAPDELCAAVAGATAMDAEMPIHIHVCETAREVEECLAGLGTRPVAWLLDKVGLDARWTLVHATHINMSERRRLAASGAVTGLCPVTEATLGDGYFPLVEYQAEGGTWGIGTDSHYTTSVAAELRMLESGKRLQLSRRNVIADPRQPVTAHSGRRLFDLALDGGSRSLQGGMGPLVVGNRADLVILDPRSPTLLSHGCRTALDAWILSGTANPVRHVMIAGQWIIKDERHPAEEQIVSGYARAMAELVDA